MGQVSATLKGLTISWEGLGIQKAGASKFLNSTVKQRSLEKNRNRTQKTESKVPLSPGRIQTACDLVFTHTAASCISLPVIFTPAHYSESLGEVRTCRWAGGSTEPFISLWCQLGYRQREQVWTAEFSTQGEGVYLFSLL